MEENENKFEVVSSKVSKANFKNRNTNNLGKNVLLPFASGIIGCSVVIGTCFGVPSIKEKLVGTSNNTVQTSTSTSTSPVLNDISLDTFSLSVNNA